MSTHILSTALSSLRSSGFSNKDSGVKRTAKVVLSAPVVEGLSSAAVDFSTKFNIGTNPYTGVSSNLPFWKAEGYADGAEKVLDHDRFCLEKDIRDMVGELGEEELGLVSATRKEAKTLEKNIGDLKLKLANKVLKLGNVVKKLTHHYGFQSWYGDLFNYPVLEIAVKPEPTPVLLSGEALAKRFMAELLTPDFLAEIAKQQLSEEEMEKVIAARAEAIITSLKELADPEAYAAFYAAYRKQHPESKSEVVVAEAAIIETSVDNGEPKVLSELVNQTVEASGSQTAMAEKLSRAAELVKEGKRKNRQQHRRAA
jgi:hypothetical protein